MKESKNPYSYWECIKPRVEVKKKRPCLGGLSISCLGYTISTSETRLCSRCKLYNELIGEAKHVKKR